MINSCYKSEFCREAMKSLKRTEAEGLMETIMKDKTDNPCKVSVSFIASQSQQSLNSLLNSYVRVSLYKTTSLRPVLLPFLHDIAHCPSIEKFNKLLRGFHETSTKIDPIEQEDLLESSVKGMHCTASGKTNHFFGGHIRFSEFKYEGEEKFRKCQEIGYLNSANWADVCGMISDYKEDYEPFLYVPEVPETSWRQLENSPTRLVIITGKLDTQTPHDLAQNEFDRLPMREKYIFTADHAGHGIINSWEVPGFTLDLIISFLTTGSRDDLKSIQKSLEGHNEKPDRIWKADGDAKDKLFESKFDIWNFEQVTRSYWWWGFVTFLLGSLLPPWITFLILCKPTIKKPNSDL